MLCLGNLPNDRSSITEEYRQEHENLKALLIKNLDNNKTALTSVNRIFDMFDTQYHQLLNNLLDPDDIAKYRINYKDFIFEAIARGIYDMSQHGFDAKSVLRDLCEFHYSREYKEKQEAFQDVRDELEEHRKKIFFHIKDKKVINF